MRLIIKILTTLFLTVLIVGCACVRFSTLTPLIRYSVGDTIVTPAAEIEVERYQTYPSGWKTDGQATVAEAYYAGNPAFAGPVILSNGVNLNFKFNYPISEITLKFNQAGLNTNIRVNGDLKNVTDPNSLNGTTIGGVLVTVAASRDGENWIGEIALDGTINDFAIGGEELFVDDVCPSR